MSVQEFLFEKVQELILKNDELRKKEHEARQRATIASEGYSNMLTRVAELSPQKQFEAVYRHPDGTQTRLAILAANSSNGKTTITVERAV